ncbi:sugar phosphate isomerase/epimerase family protein [Bauldia sp.]|uniref:sugar phosphate isomerase/epimerase family protein n=1 Tax=Bauldia sp. TaxID=2575872 RepID=UPI003BAC27DB
MGFGQNKLGVHALCWVGGWSEAEARKAIEGTARVGYDLIEIPALDPTQIDSALTARLLEEYGLAATISLGLGPETDISSADPEAAKRGEALLMDVVSIARDIGASDICGVIFSALTKYAEPATAAGLAQSVDVLARVCEAAAGNGITVGMEVVNRYETNIANTAAQGVALCDMIGAPNVKVHLDTYHMNIEEADAARAIVETGDRLSYFHLGESHRGYLGSGSIDFVPIFRALAQIDFSGPMVFESFSSEVVDPTLSRVLAIWRNLWTDGEDLISHARDFTRAQMTSAIRTESLAHTKGVLQGG